MLARVQTGWFFVLKNTLSKTCRLGLVTALPLLGDMAWFPTFPFPQTVVFSSAVA